jgi:hypothetical protein
MSSLGHYPNKVTCEAIAETLDASLLEKGVVSHKKLNGINNQSRLAAFTKIILFLERFIFIFFSSEPNFVKETRESSK